MSGFLNELKKYFESTPVDKINEAWERTAHWDYIGPTVKDFMTTLSNQILFDSSFYEHYITFQDLDFSPKFTSGFFLNSI